MTQFFAAHLGVDLLVELEQLAVARLKGTLARRLLFVVCASQSGNQQQIRADRECIP
jgi:hypothetical protein